MSIYHFAPPPLHGGVDGVGGPSVKWEVEDGGSSDNVVGGNHGGVALGGDDDVRDTLEVGGDRSHVVLVQLASLCSETRVEDGIVGGVVRIVKGECNVVTWHSGADGQSGEGHDGEGSVGRRAASDKGRSDGVDHVETQRCVERSRPGVNAESSGALPSLVSGLGRVDCNCGSDVGRGGDVLSGTGVCTDTDVLDHSSERDKRLGVGVGAARESAHSSRRKKARSHDSQLVGARLNRVVTESTREEGDVLGLVSGDLGDSASDPVGESSAGKVILRVGSEGIGAERGQTDRQLRIPLKIIKGTH